MARTLGRDATNLLSTSALPKLDLAQRLASTLGWRLDDLAQTLLGRGPPHGARAADVDGPLGGVGESTCAAPDAEWYAQGRPHQVIEWRLEQSRSMQSTSAGSEIETTHLLALAAAHETRGELDLAHALCSRIVVRRGRARSRGASGALGPIAAIAADAVARLVWRRALLRFNEAAPSHPDETVPECPGGDGPLCISAVTSTARTKVESLLGRPLTLVSAMDAALVDWRQRTGFVRRVSKRDPAVVDESPMHERIDSSIRAVGEDAAILNGCSSARSAVGGTGPRAAPDRAQPSRSPLAVVLNHRASARRQRPLEPLAAGVEEQRMRAAWAGAWTLEWVLAIGDVGCGMLPGRGATSASTAAQIDPSETARRRRTSAGGGDLPSMAGPWDRDLERRLQHSAATFSDALVAFALHWGAESSHWPLLDVAMRLEHARRRRVELWTGAPTPWELTEIEMRVILGLMGRYPAWRTDGWSVLSQSGAW